MFGVRKRLAALDNRLSEIESRQTVSDTEGPSDSEGPIATIETLGQCGDRLKRLALAIVMNQERLDVIEKRQELFKEYIAKLMEVVAEECNRPDIAPIPDKPDTGEKP